MSACGPTSLASAFHHLPLFRPFRADRIARKPTGSYREEKLPDGSRPFADMQLLWIGLAMRLARSMVVALLLVGLGACGSSKVMLPACWYAADLQQGERFIGTVLIFAAPDIRPMVFPVACDGGVTANLPDGVRLPVHKEGEHPDADGEGVFYEARVAGQVEGVAFGRPSVRLSRVISPKQVIPSWSRGNVR
jgi:hypothetical protein